VFDPAGRLIDEAVRAQVQQFISGFGDFVARFGEERSERTRRREA
jgi:hypothetical protein